MTDTPLIHVVRQGPLWATGMSVTECGNAAKDGDLTHDEMATLIRKKYRGSAQRAYADCCVTCIQTGSRHGYGRSEQTEQVHQLIAHLIRLPARRFPDEVKRRNAEVEAIHRLIGEHYEEFSMLVESIMHGPRLVEPNDE